jgi:cysteine-rich repeat protein
VGGGAHSGGGASGGTSGGTGGKNTAGAGGEVAVCGNGRTEDGEECDDSEESAECNVDCTLAECGDGVRNASAGEACDDEGESATCNDDCTVAECGDEKVNATAGEECDGEFKVYTDGQWLVLTTNYCLECKKNTCGDGIPVDRTPVCDEFEIPECSGEMLEQCDTSGESSTCDADCTDAYCGDEYTNEADGEECDDGNWDSGDGCDGDCKLE